GHTLLLWRLLRAAFAAGSQQRARKEDRTLHRFASGLLAGPRDPVSWARLVMESSQFARAWTSCARALARAVWAVSRSRMLPTPALYRPSATSADCRADARRSCAEPTCFSAVLTPW